MEQGLLNISPETAASGGDCKVKLPSTVCVGRVVICLGLPTSIFQNWISKPPSLDTELSALMLKHSGAPPPISKPDGLSPFFTL